jgi:endonuclease/exonuclease/phosphatase family metal-dependent hydrolase
LTAEKRNQPTGSDERRSLLAVATYNVHACVGRDGKTSPERVARVIGELDADIVGLQEVDSRPGAATDSQQMDYLARTTGYDAIPGVTIQRHDRSYGNVLLTRHCIRAVRRIDLSLAGREPRGAIDADLEVHGKRLRVLVTHLGLRAAERRLQLSRLSELFSHAAIEPMVLMGDFNEWRPYQSTLQRLQTLFGYCPAPRSFPARCPMLALDRIWIRPLSLLITTHAHKTALARVASDHLPVKTLLRLRPTLPKLSNP